MTIGDDKIFVVHPSGYWQCLDLRSVQGKEAVGRVSLGTRLGKVSIARLRACPQYDHFYDLDSDTFSATAPLISISGGDAEGDDSLNINRDDGVRADVIMEDGVKTDEADQGTDVSKRIKLADLGARRPNDCLVDDNTAQRLQREDIARLRHRPHALSAQTVVATLVEHSSSFGQKTRQAQEKYIARKHRKYARFVQIKRADAANALRLLAAQGKQAAVGYLRWDTFGQLSLLIKYALPSTTTSHNAYGRVLIFDECSGGLLAADLAQHLRFSASQSSPFDSATSHSSSALLDSSSMVLCVHDKQQPNHGFLDSLIPQCPELKASLIHSLHIDALTAGTGNEDERMTIKGPTRDSHPAYVQRWERLQRTVTRARLGPYDALAILVQGGLERLPELVRRLGAWLKPAGRLLIYTPGHNLHIQSLFIQLLHNKKSSNSKESNEDGMAPSTLQDGEQEAEIEQKHDQELNQAQEVEQHPRVGQECARTSRDFVDVHLWTTWTREYQTDAGRLHPTMTRKGCNAGLLLSSFKVVPDD